MSFNYVLAEKEVRLIEWTIRMTLLNKAIELANKDDDIDPEDDDGYDEE